MQEKEKRMKIVVLILFGIAVFILCMAFWNVNPYLYLTILLLFLFIKHKKSKAKITLIDMYYQDGKYTYVYFWDTKKVEFISNIPHLWWTEIDKMLLNENYDLATISILNKPVKLKYGNISICKFSEKEEHKYNNFENIETLLNNAIGKQMALSEAYNKEYGHPDLHDLH